MLIDPHAHTSGISRCCKADARSVLQTAREAGLDGIVLTNHYLKDYLEGGSAADFARKYVAEFDRTKAEGDALGVKVMFGIELTPEWNKSCHLLIYGVTPAFALEDPALFDDPLEKIYRKVHAAGGVLVQAHTYRGEKRLLDTRWLDGVEISCHPLYRHSFSSEMAEIADREGLILTCGGDYHNDTYRPQCGIYLPEEIADGIAFGRYLADTERIRLRIHEPYGEIYDMDFTRQRSEKS